MKLKGISVFEQHVEKAVLGFFVLILLAVFAYQFVGNPNAVQVGNKPVSPDEATEAVQEMARQVKAKLEAVQAPSIPAQASVAGEAKKAMEGDAFDPKPVVLAGAIGGVGPKPGATPIIAHDGQGGLKFEKFAPPAPTDVVAAVYEGAIDPVVPLTIKEAAKYLPKEQPYDLRSVSVQASVDARKIREALTAAPTAPGVSALPAAFWQSKVEILDVELVRQSRNAAGEWVDDSTVIPLPGRTSLRDRLVDPNTKPMDLVAILDAEKAHREDIRRPRYYPMIAGGPWVRPAIEGGASSAGAANPDVKRRLDQIANLRREIEQTEKALAPKPEKGQPGKPGAGKPGGNPPDRDGRDGGGGGGSGGKPGGRADASPDSADDVHWPYIPPDVFAQGGVPPGRPPEGGQPGGNPAEDEHARAEKKKKELEQKKERLLKDIQNIEESLKKDGFDAKGNPLNDPRTAAFDEPLTSVTDPASEKITVWAHDITAQPGMTYRYKVRVWFTNPLFGNGAGLDDTMKADATKPAIASADSEPSSPVTVEPNVRYFITRASIAGAVGGGETAALESEASASGEVFEFFYGYWRKGTFRMSAGDQVRASVDLPELTTFEMSLAADGKSVDNSSIKPVPLKERKRSLSRDAFMLDVVPVSAAGSAPTPQVLMRELQGQIEARTPSADDTSSVRQRMAQSSDLGARVKLGQPGAAEGPGSDQGGGSPPPEDRDGRGKPPGGGAPPLPPGSGGPDRGGAGGKPR